MRRAFLTGVALGLLLVAVMLAGPAASRMTANARAGDVKKVSIGNSGWKKEFKTIRSAHVCSWHGRVALCRTVRVWVHRYGYVGGSGAAGLIYNSGQTLHIVWRYYLGRDKWCLRCLLSVRSTNYESTLPYDPTWDWDSMILSSHWGPCTVAEHLSPHGCSETYREHLNRFINYYVLNPIPLTRTETAGVTSHIYLRPRDRNHHLAISSTAHCC